MHLWPKLRANNEEKANEHTTEGDEWRKRAISKEMHINSEVYSTFDAYLWKRILKTENVL